MKRDQKPRGEFMTCPPCETQWRGEYPATCDWCGQLAVRGTLRAALEHRRLYRRAEG